MKRPESFEQFVNANRSNESLPVTTKTRFEFPSHNQNQDPFANAEKLSIQAAFKAYEEARNK